MDEKQSSVTLASSASGKDGPKGMGDRIVVKSALATMGTPEYFTRFDAVKPSELLRRKAIMGDDPALPKMPAAPTLFDFFRLRFAPAQASHLLQSANFALKSGVDEKGVLACLLHDISMVSLLQTDHGYWGAQLILPLAWPPVSTASASADKTAAALALRASHSRHNSAGFRDPETGPAAKGFRARQRAASQPRL